MAARQKATAEYQAHAIDKAARDAKDKAAAEAQPLAQEAAAAAEQRASTDVGEPARAAKASGKADAAKAAAGPAEAAQRHATAEQEALMRQAASNAKADAFWPATAAAVDREAQARQVATEKVAAAAAAEKAHQEADAVKEERVRRQAEAKAAEACAVADAQAAAAVLEAAAVDEREARQAAKENVQAATAVTQQQAAKAKADITHAAAAAGVFAWAAQGAAYLDRHGMSRIGNLMDPEQVGKMPEQQWQGLCVHLKADPTQGMDLVPFQGFDALRGRVGLVHAKLLHDAAKLTDERALAALQKERKEQRRIAAEELEQRVAAERLEQERATAEKAERQRRLERKRLEAQEQQQQRQRQQQQQQRASVQAAAAAAVAKEATVQRKESPLVKAETKPQGTKPAVAANEQARVTETVQTAASNPAAKPDSAAASHEEDAGNEHTYLRRFYQQTDIGRKASRKFTSNLHLLVIYGSVLTDCLCYRRVGWSGKLG